MSIFNFLSRELEKWQKARGLELVKFSDPGPVPIYDESGAQIRAHDASPLMSIMAEIHARARLDPLYKRDWRAAIRKYSEIVSRERGIPFNARR